VKGKGVKIRRKGNQEILMKKYCSYYKEIETFTALRIPRMCPLLPSEYKGEVSDSEKVKCLTAKW
jgi:hypothetical protein